MKGEKMTPQTKTQLGKIEKDDHQEMGWMSCGGDEYQLSIGKGYWSVDNALFQMLEVIETDDSISSFSIMSGANNYDHVFTRLGEGWLIQSEQIENGVFFQETTTIPVSMTYLIDSHPDDWEEKFDWKKVK